MPPRWATRQGFHGRATVRQCICPTGTASWVPSMNTRHLSTWCSLSWQAERRHATHHRAIQALHIACGHLGPGLLHSSPQRGPVWEGLVNERFCDLRPAMLHRIEIRGAGRPRLQYSNAVGSKPSTRGRTGVARCPIVHEHPPMGLGGATGPDEGQCRGQNLVLIRGTVLPLVTQQQDGLPVGADGQP